MYDAIIISSSIGGMTCGALLAKHGLYTLIVGCQQTNPKEFPPNEDNAITEGFHTVVVSSYAVAF